MSKKKDITAFVEQKIDVIRLRSEPGESGALLAQLRRGLGKTPGEVPAMFGVVLEDMPETFMSRTGKPTEAEWACYTALTLFALHQQGKDLKTECMHTKERVSMGNAVRKLAYLTEDANAEGRFLKRLEALATASDMNGFSHHARAIVKLLGGSSVPLNYALLAGDIYEWQFSESRQTVNLRWGQDFYKQVQKQEETKDE